MPSTLTQEFDIHFRQGRRGKKELRSGADPAPSTPPTGRVPRIARLMALAIRFEELLRQGLVADYAELAALGHVSRARITQIMNLTLLAPDIQEAILYLPRTEEGGDSIRLREMQPIALTADWRKQRQGWIVLAER